MAEQTEHTPGGLPAPQTWPVLGTWTLALDQQTGGLVWVAEAAPEIEANTRLMLEAPNLLAALKWALDVIEDNIDAEAAEDDLPFMAGWNQARAARAAAEA